MNDIFQKFSPNLKRALIDAETIATSKKMSVDTEHQLLSLLQNKDTLAFEILSSFEVTPDRIELISSLIGHDKETKITSDAKKTIQLAVQFASRYHHNNIGSEHLLLALISSKSFHSYLILERIGIDPKKIKRQIESIFKGISDSFQKNEENLNSFIQPGFDPQNSLDDLGFAGDQPVMPFAPLQREPKKESALDQYSSDLTALASAGKLDPVVGREKEINRLIQTLSRRTKNNPILVGEPGVGKTAIVEGLAQRIITGNVPTKIAKTEIRSIDLGSILAGTMYRGQFESRIKKILSEIEKRGNIILFIDEIHMMVGAGATEGSIDAANLLKPMLAKGQLRLIGSTTFDEYKKHIERDPAFERRFQPIQVAEPDKMETVEILHGVKGRYEKFHNVSYDESAIEAAAELSLRYIHDRFLPDKAIDLIDEAGAAKNSKVEAPSKSQLMKLELDQLLKEKEDLIALEKYEEATKLRQKEIELIADIQKIDTENGPTKAVTADDIASLVSDWTGVPVNTLSNIEKKRYLNLEKTLSKYVIGQKEAISELAKSIKRARVGISHPHRPIGSFIFLGPTGVGKTELAKVLSREIFGSEDNLIRIDMSEFMEKHNVARLIGAPAGYVGYEEGGKLTEQVRKNPYSVILFDEIEKAHPEVFNILLQIMDEGALTDAKGRSVNFKNTIIIMTSNLGTDVLNRQTIIGFNQSKSDKAKYERLKESVLETVEKSFRPEFLNRLDKVIVFYPLDEISVKKIVVLQLSELVDRLINQKITLKYNINVVDWIAKESFNPEYGARPIRKFIGDHIETAISDAILSEQYKAGATIALSLKDNKVVLS